jgi:prophage antirepressor-like protein
MEGDLMMNELQKVFSYHNAKIRTVILGGEPWFVAKDVCEILEIQNHIDAIKRLDNDEKGVVSIYPLGQKQEANAVNEFGLYNLILGSRKEEAKQFKRWVTHEVLPSIRKTGSYTSNIDQQITHIIGLNGDIKTKKQLARDALREYKNIVMEQIQDLELSKPEHIIKFLSDCCIADPDSVIEQRRLYQAYFMWCVSENQEPYGKITFTRKIESFSEAEYLPSNYKTLLNARFVGLALSSS